MWYRCLSLASPVFLLFGFALANGAVTARTTVRRWKPSICSTPHASILEATIDAGAANEPGRPAGARHFVASVVRVGGSLTAPG